MCFVSYSPQIYSELSKFQNRRNVVESRFQYRSTSEDQIQQFFKKDIYSYRKSMQKQVLKKEEKIQKAKSNPERETESQKNQMTVKSQGHQRENLESLLQQFFQEYGKKIQENRLEIKTQFSELFKREAAEQQGKISMIGVSEPKFMYFKQRILDSLYASIEPGPDSCQSFQILQRDITKNYKTFKKALKDLNDNELKFDSFIKLISTRISKFKRNTIAFCKDCTIFYLKSTGNIETCHAMVNLALKANLNLRQSNEIRFSINSVNLLIDTRLQEIFGQNGCLCPNLIMLNKIIKDDSQKDIELQIDEAQNFF